MNEVEQVSFWSELSELSILCNLIVLVDDINRSYQHLSTSWPERSMNDQFGQIYPLANISNSHITMERPTIFQGKTYYCYAHVQ